MLFTDGSPASFNRRACHNPGCLVGDQTAKGDTFERLHRFSCSSVHSQLQHSPMTRCQGPGHGAIGAAPAGHPGADDKGAGTLIYRYVIIQMRILPTSISFDRENCMIFACHFYCRPTALGGFARLQRLARGRSSAFFSRTRSTTNMEALQAQVRAVDYSSSLTGRLVLAVIRERAFSFLSWAFFNLQAGRRVSPTTRRTCMSPARSFSSIADWSPELPVSEL